MFVLINVNTEVCVDSMHEYVCSGTHLVFADEQVGYKLAVATAVATAASGRIRSWSTACHNRPTCWTGATKQYTV